MAAWQIVLALLAWFALSVIVGICLGLFFKAAGNLENQFTDRTRFRVLPTSERNRCDPVSYSLADGASSARREGGR